MNKQNTNRAGRVFNILALVFVFCAAALLGFGTQVRAEEKEVDKLEYQALDRYYMQDENSYWELTGDKVIVTYKDGSEETFCYERDDDYGHWTSETDGHTIPVYNPNDVDHSMSVDYNYDTKTYWVSYMGMTAEAPGVAYFAKSISFSQKEVRRMHQGRDSEKATDANGVEYDEYGLNDWGSSDRYAKGDVLTVTYENAFGQSKSIDYAWDDEKWDFYMDTSDGRDADDYLYYGNLTIVADQAANHLTPRKDPYSFNLEYREYDGDLSFTTSGEPYQVKIISETPQDAETVAAIEGLTVSPLVGGGIALAYDSCQNPPFGKADHFRVTCVNEGKTLMADNDHYASEEDGVIRFSSYQILNGLNPASAGSRVLLFGLEAINEDNEIIARSELKEVSFNITKMVKDPAAPAEGLSDTLRYGSGLNYISPNVYVRQSYTWNIDGSEAVTNSTYIPGATITSVKSSNTKVLTVKKDGSNYILTPVKVGKATVTINYKENGKTKTAKKTVSVVDKYLQVQYRSPGLINYNETPAGMKGTFKLQAVLYTYNAKKKGYERIADVTDSTKFTVKSIKCHDYADGKDVSGKVTASVKGSTLTFKGDPSIKNGEMTIDLGTVCGTVKGAYQLWHYIASPTDHIIIPENFLFPLNGKSSLFDPAMYHYENGAKSEAPFGNVALYYDCLTVTDRSGAAVESGAILSADSLPLTITTTDETNAWFRFTALKEDGTTKSWVSMSGSDYLHNAKVSMAKSKVYTGKAIKPSAKVTYGGTTIKPTVSWLSNKNVGSASAVLRYNGDELLVPFKILPKGTSLKTLTPLSKGMTVKWAAQKTQTTGYQVQYSLKKAFTSGNKTATITKNGTLSKKITKLKSKKTYYFRVRTYKTVYGVKYYSAWSKPKSAKAK